MIFNVYTRQLAALNLVVLGLLLAGCTATDPAATGSTASGPVATASPGEPIASGSSSQAGTTGPPGTESGSPDSADATPPQPSGSLAPVPTKSRKTLDPTPPGETATTKAGVDVALRSWKPVKIKAGAPGEIGGPGVVLNLRVTNDSDEPVELKNVVVDLRYGADQTPAIRSDRSPTKAFSGTLAPGESASARYAFRIDKSDRDDVSVLVGLNTDIPVVVFEGDVS